MPKPTHQHAKTLLLTPQQARDTKPVWEHALGATLPNATVNSAFRR